MTADFALPPWGAGGCADVGGFIGRPGYSRSVMPLEEDLFQGPAPSEDGGHSSQWVACDQVSFGGHALHPGTLSPYALAEELLWAALHCVAQRAGFDFRDVCSWCREALPEEVWLPLRDRAAQETVEAEHPEKDIQRFSEDELANRLAGAAYAAMEAHADRMQLEMPFEGEFRLRAGSHDKIRVGGSHIVSANADTGTCDTDERALAGRLAAAANAAAEARAQRDNIGVNLGDVGVPASRGHGLKKVAARHGGGLGGLSAVHAGGKCVQPSRRG
eukprot:TRINITY_DN21225_c0_g1_i1.p1 TRINITY_DN21225_c0_g1~~TRINITY_DN21225_c0_g1_i1.p1  ORF type:complete len:303 (-),score=59.64 TRINITY_DN21225_c0_g1_i1:463-1284(-)